MESDENTSRLETPSDVFTRLRGLVISELGVLGSLPSSFQDGNQIQEAGWGGCGTQCGQWQAQPGLVAALGKQALFLLGLLSKLDGKEAKGAIQREAKRQACTLPRRHCEPCSQARHQAAQPPRNVPWDYLASSGT